MKFPTIIQTYNNILFFIILITNKFYSTFYKLYNLSLFIQKLQ